MKVEANDPTYLGRVLAVTGPSISVQLAESLASGLAIIEGRTYRVGQVGSFVRIPQGYQDLYGIVTQIGAKGTGEDLADSAVLSDDRWMTVELVGESIGEHFERGLSQHPNINDAVHIVTERDLRRIYGGKAENQIEIGSLSSADNISVKLSLDALVTRHSALLGSTGAGKSTTVASLLRSVVRGDSESGGLPGARVLLLDLHGEYTAALADIAEIFSATPQPSEKPLHIPYWALEAGELLELVVGNLGENQEIAFTDKIYELKSARVAASSFPGLDPLSLTVDTPVPFSLKRMWYDLVDFETRTYIGQQRDQPALQAAGNADQLVPPQYQPHAMGNVGPFLNQAAKGIKRQLNLLRSRLLDKRYDFILHPGVWEPDLDGNTEADLGALLKGWLGHDRQITILDLSGVPSNVLVRMIGTILRIVYDALYWSREKSEGGFWRPLLVVMEEAHRYLGADQDNVAADMVRRIAKEGRKYGIGAMVISQRPSEVDETVLSQCGTTIALRLTNPQDRTRVKGALPDNLAGLTDLLPVLRTGEALVVGEAARLPVRCRVRLPAPEYRPRSADPQVTQAWRVRRVAESYDRMVASWRAQRTIAVVTDVKINRDRIKDEEA